ncbi:methyltransferase domain-containing protein [Acidobacteria bacterium AB60]|nr:methyltransferase domain-containing protein [Acidobacteria bacterium AB60]
MEGRPQGRGAAKPGRPAGKAAPGRAAGQPASARPAGRPATGGTAKPAAPRPAQERPAAPEFPATGAIVSRRAADRIRAGHVWVYASDVERSPSNANSFLVPVADSRGLLLGTALYSPSSQIALRLVARESLGEAQWLQVAEDRLRRSIQRRLPLLRPQDTDSTRLVFSEADELPGLVVDKYGELIVLQLLAKGLDSATMRDLCVRTLREELSPAAIFERPDPRVRELEGLSAPATTPLWAAENEAPLTRTAFHLNGLRFEYDANAGQKTGAFLDQRNNYAAAREYARRSAANGRALDVCTYQGGFALHLAQACAEVIGIDASRASLEVAERNLDANRERLGAAVEWVEADAFELLRDWSDGGQRFDAIVLDPPAFAKSKRAVEGALRGYKELNLRVLKMVRSGGLLVTCSCSHHVGWADLEGAVASAAADAHRRVRLLERRGAAPDHPVILNLPETEYLKCLVLEVE